MSPRSSSGRRSRARPLGDQPAPQDSAPEVPTVARWGSGSTRSSAGACAKGSCSQPQLAEHGAGHREGGGRPPPARPARAGTAPGRRTRARTRPGPARAPSRSRRPSGTGRRSGPSRGASPGSGRGRRRPGRSGPSCRRGSGPAAFAQRSWIRNAASDVGVRPAGDLEHGAVEGVVVRAPASRAASTGRRSAPGSRPSATAASAPAARATRRASARRGTAGAAASRSCPAG